MEGRATRARAVRSPLDMLLVAAGADSARPLKVDVNATHDAKTGGDRAEDFQKEDKTGSGAPRFPLIC